MVRSWQGSPPQAAETLRILAGALLDVLAVQRYVEPFALLFFADPQSNGHIDDFEDDVADDEAVDQGGEHAFQLGEDASGLATIERRAGKSTREQCADDATDAVHPERIERIVVTHSLLERSRGEEADDPGGHADDDRGCGHHEPRSRRDRHQAGDGTGGDDEHTSVALDGPL